MSSFIYFKFQLYLFQIYISFLNFQYFPQIHIVTFKFKTKLKVNEKEILQPVRHFELKANIKRGVN